MSTGKSLCVVFVWLASLVLAGAQSDPSTPYSWNLPRTFPRPRMPADNAMSDAKVELGRYLFYDTRLSENGTQSCASCHEQERAFTDGRPRAVGSTGEMHPRGSMSLVNIAYVGRSPGPTRRMTQLEDQALVPMFGEYPVELGLDRVRTELSRA